MSKPHSHTRRIIERRKHPRIFTPSGALVSYSHLATPGQSEEHSEGEGTLIDLSFGGCRLHSDIPLEISHRYHLILQVSKTSRPLIIETAIVQWVQGNTHGLKFISLHSIHESHLRELLRDIRRPVP